MSAHFQWAASPSEKAGLLLSALLIGLVNLNLGSRGLDTAAGRTASVSGVAGPSRRSPALYDLYQRLPLTFERNAGQTDRRVKFLARGPGYTLFLTGDEAVLSLRSQESGARSQKQEGRPWSLVPSLLQRPTDSTQGTKDNAPGTNDVLHMKLVGANQAVKVTALDELPGKSNYFIGNDPKKWRTDVPTYGKVKYAGVYPGIDLVYYGNQRQLEYDFVVAPGADPEAITLEIENRNSKLAARQSKIQKPVLSAAKDRESKIDANGDLVVQAEGGEIRFHKPVVYQPTADAANPKSKIQNRKLLDGRYVLSADNHIRFDVSGYDKTKPLVSRVLWTGTSASRSSSLTRR